MRRSRSRSPTTTALFALVVGNAGALLRGQQRSAPARLAPVWTWQPVRHAVAVAVAASLATLAGIGHPYWAMVAAVAPRPAAGLLFDRGVETVIGALVAIAVIGYDERRRRRRASGVQLPATR